MVQAAGWRGWAAGIVAAARVPGGGPAVVLAEQGTNQRGGQPSATRTCEFNPAIRLRQ